MTVPAPGTAARVTPLVASLRAAGVLTAADVHVTDAVARVTGETDPEVLLAVALAVGAPRQGHVCLELDRVRERGLAAEGEAPVDVPLPDLERWLDALRHSPAVRGPADDAATPLVLDRTRLYLDRYWRYEERLVTRLRQLIAEERGDRDAAEVARHLDALFPGVAPDDPQRSAAEVAATRALTVLTGGPGTGKTTTVVRILAVLLATAPAPEPPRVVLAAPTGKAAARMAEAVRDAVATLPVDGPAADALRAVPAMTLHRLLGWRPDAPSRFRHHAGHRLPHDVVIVDEASMASLPLMAKLVDALPDQGRLVLVGDRDQLTSIDAGAVLDDLCGPRDRVTRGPVDGAGAGVDLRSRLATSNVELTTFHRFGAGTGIGAVARAIRRADADEVVALLRRQGEDTPEVASSRDAVLVAPTGGGGDPLPAAVWTRVLDAYRFAVDLARRGAPPRDVLAAYDRMRVLTALRRGPDGVDAVTRAVAAALDTPLVPVTGGHDLPLGLPLIVTRNDARIQLFNGDVGVVVADPGDARRRRVAFPTPDGDVRLVPPARLPEPEPVYAMSVHKAQGSQYDEVVLVLPRVSSPLLSRELVYTGITRARHQVTVVATEERLREALGRGVQRASGLAERLWGQG